jgi:DNA repair protein RadC
MDLQNTKVAEVQLTYKTTVKASERPQVNTSQEVHRVLESNWNYETIEFIE